MSVTLVVLQVQKKSGRSSSSKYSKSSTRTKKKKNLKRNVKEGSPIEEECIIENLKELKIEDSFINKLNELSEVLILVKMNDKANQISNLVKEYVLEVNAKIKKLFLFKQIQYANEHPEICELFQELKLDEFLFNNEKKNDPSLIKMKKEDKKFK